MYIEKAYILRTQNPTSIEYSEISAKTCDAIGLPYEFFEGYDHKELKKNKINLWDEVGEIIDVPKGLIRNDGGSCATAGHFLIWKKILDNKECAIVLEHDSLMLHKLALDIPDYQLVVLGYKVTDPHKYFHEYAGPPEEILDRKKHGGAHAYALTYKTAESFLTSIKNSKGNISYVDNQFFFGTQGRGNVTMGITNPTCAIGWLRESTIWAKSAVDNYGPILQSFLENYHSKEDMGVKK